MGGAAHTIPTLRLPREISGRPLTRIAKVKRIENAKIDEIECLRIQGQYAGYSMTIWIDKETYLVRRIDSEKKFDNFLTEETTTYKPFIDEEIADSLL